MKRITFILFIIFLSVPITTFGQSNMKNASKVVPTAEKIDVWDFGAAELSTDIYNNNLTVDSINAWLPSVTAGTTGKNVPMTWTAGALTWTSTSATSDRLRTSNTALTRYDSNGSPFTFGSETLTGALYVNATAATNRYFSIAANEDDVVAIYCKSQNASGTINFVNTTTSEVATQYSSSTGTILKFFVKTAAIYKIYDSQDKPYYYRIVKTPAKYQTFTGTVDITEAADILAGYKIVFSNPYGKTWTFSTTSNTYSATLPAGFTYSVSLEDANGYIITSSKSVDITNTTTTFNLSLKKVVLFTLTGSVTGLGNAISNMNLVFTPTVSSIYIPNPVVNTNTGTYTVDLENGYTYTISSTGINDYYLADNSITIAGATATKDLAFAAKPTYAITINAPGLTTEQAAKLQLKFTNLNETGYSYLFASTNNIMLRSGVYSVTASGLDEYPYSLDLTSNLRVTDAETSKTLSFSRVTNWSFDDATITNATTSYKGLLFSGQIANEITKGHLTAKSGSSIQVPIKVGEKMIVGYYYTAAFSINGGSMITTASNSTSLFENTEYVYTGETDGFVNIAIGSEAATTYITEISIVKTVEYQVTLSVGTDKPYQTINEALKAVSMMNRPGNERVTILIDPGNYEEMLVINTPNITLKNAALNSGIGLLNKGVDIADNAVRITSYYGHGYSYYSMGNDQKWNADVLEVNKENGYLSYENKGAGTTNGSWWNATVVVNANGFVANDIIFENSFNQYISKKESEDVIVLWESGNKGLRPTDIGNTNVQKKSFVERAAAIAITNNTDKVILSKCRVVGRQDSFFGGTETRVVVYKGAIMGGTDYTFGGMAAVFYKSDLVMNTSDDSGDQSYLTAAQQSSGRGYLMYECNITSAIPEIETASIYLSKPGYFGRPWQATTSEVVFYNTTIDTTNVAGSVGKSLISPVGWLSTLGGESNKMYEYGTIEKSGENNQSARASWSSILTQPTLTDGTAINTFNFTKGNDNWDPIPQLIADDVNDAVTIPQSTSKVQIRSFGDHIFIENVKSKTDIKIYSASGALVKTLEVNSNINVKMNTGLWIVRVADNEGIKTSKLILNQNDLLSKTD